MRGNFNIEFIWSFIRSLNYTKEVYLNIQLLYEKQFFVASDVTLSIVNQQNEITSLHAQGYYYYQR